ncbi:hypothetical protein [Methylobacterium sp. NEAU K]|uniref:hypothetical protein n=1 Tax=Methylobacterium sp. NEAU K TaxID=3064946 RepID=UPI002735ED1B|nr:hypothetical protein [Methylobacterium sp. NEAU K]MDP4002671.1 hypothetical protein [Methylobacterium sp. NEAU K]
MPRVLKTLTVIGLGTLGLAISSAIRAAPEAASVFAWPRPDLEAARAAPQQDRGGFLVGKSGNGNGNGNGNFGNGNGNGNRTNGNGNFGTGNGRGNGRPSRV